MGLKARVKATGEIVEIILKQVDPIQQKYVNCETGVSYYREELVFDVNQKCFPYDEDYWTRFEHQAAIGAMQGILGSEEIMKRINTMPIKEDQFGLVIAELSVNITHALVKKMKEERK